MSTNDLNSPDPLASNPDPQFPHRVTDSHEANFPPRTDVSAPTAPAEHPVHTSLAAPEQHESSKAGEIAGEARDLARESQDSAKHLGEKAQREAEHIVEDVKAEASHLFEELGTDVRAQAAIQQEKIGANLRDISQELRAMLAAAPSHGNAASLVDQAAQHSGKIADWLEAREPGDLVEEVKGFARRRPGAFLGLAVGAGLLAGRITRNAGGSSQDSAKSTSRGAASESATRVETASIPRIPDETVDSGVAPPPALGTRTDPGYLGS